MAQEVKPRDYIVVSSTDSKFQKGATFAEGERISLAPNTTLTVITASGDLRVINGSFQGAVLPKLRAAMNPIERLESLIALISAPPVRRTFGVIRAGQPETDPEEGCPAASVLTTIDSILEAEKSECFTAARTAFQAYLAANVAETAPPPE